MRLLYAALIIILIALTAQTSMAKLSSRERAAKKAGGTLSYKSGKVSVAPKASSRVLASKSSSPWGSAGDAISGEGSMTNAQYENKIAQGLGSASSVAAARNEAKLTSSPQKQREAASKAKSRQSSNSGNSGLSGNIPKGLTFGDSTTDIGNTKGLSIGGGYGDPGITKFGRLLQIANDPFGSGEKLTDLPKSLFGKTDLGITEKFGLNDFLRIPTASANYTDAYGGGANKGIIDLALSDGNPQTTQSDQPFSQQMNERTGDNGLSGTGASVFDNATTTGGTKTQNSDNNNKKNDWVNPWGDVDISGEGNTSSTPSTYQPTQEEVSQQQNEQYGGGMLQDTSSGTTGNRSGRGSGAFGTGKGVMSDDPYIKELRKAYSSNGGEKWLRKQFDELIKALDPTYAQLQTEGTNALNENLRNNSNQLASVMNAGNVGDSEQRTQQLAGLQQGNQTALGQLLAKLAQGKASDVSGYKSQEAEAMSKYSQNKQQDARTLLEKIQAYKGQQGQGQTAGRVAGPAKTPKLSRNDIFNWTEDALSKGYSWQEIAENAQEQGIGTETGGYLDQLLNQANKQNRYR